MMVDPTGFWGDGFWGDEPAALVQLSAMGLVLAVCALGVAIILVVAVNEWRLWRRSRQVQVDVPLTVHIDGQAIAGAVAEALRRQRAKQTVVFDWDWPAA